MLKRVCLLTGLLALATQPVLALPGPTPAGLNLWNEARYVRAMQTGQASLAKGDFDASQKAFESALSLSPQSGEARNDLGEAQYRAKQYAQAQKTFEQGKKAALPASQARAAYQTGNSLFRQNKLEEAAEGYRQALRLDENDEDARYNLQITLDRLHRNQPDKKPADKPKPFPKDKDTGKPDKGAGKDGKPKDPGGKQDPKEQSNQPGKPDPKKEGSQTTSGQPKPGAGKEPGKEPVPSKEDGSEKDPAVSGSPHPSASGSPQRAASDGDRILQYYQNQERQAKLQPKTGGRPVAPSQ